MLVKFRPSNIHMSVVYDFGDSGGESDGEDGPSSALNFRLRAREKKPSYFEDSEEEEEDEWD